MDINPVSALNPYAYPTTLQPQGTATAKPQSAAVLQALASAYSNANDSGLLPSADALAALAGSGAQASLAQGMAEAATASGLTQLPASDLSGVATALGGVSAATVSELLPAESSAGASGFDSALNQNAALALEAYTSSIPEGNLSKVAAEEAAKTSTPAAAVQSALASSQASLLNLLG